MTKLSNLIALTGLKSSGKSTAGRALVRYGGYAVLNFAEPLKEMLGHLMTLRGCPPEELPHFLEGERKEWATEFLLGKSPREAMQRLGTEWGREQIDPKLWVDTFERRAKRALAKGEQIVVTDVRFANEVEAVQKLGGKVYRVMRPGVGRTNHASERDVLELPVSGEIDNIAMTAGGFEYYVRQYFSLV